MERPDAFLRSTSATSVSYLADRKIAQIKLVPHVEQPHHRVETKRSRPAECLHLPIDRLPLAYMLLDSKFRVLDWNSTAERIFGYTKDEASGQVASELLLWPPIDAATRDIIRRIEAGDMQVHCVNNNRTKDRRTIACQWFNTPLMEADGGFGGVISLVQDVTEQQRVEELLHQAQRRFKAIFENALDPIVLLDDSLHCVDGNPAVCEMFGVSRDELLQMTAFDIAPTEDHQTLTTLFAQLLSGGTLSGESTLLTRSGETKIIEYRAVARFFPGLHQVFLRDVSEQKRSEETKRDYLERLQILSHRVLEFQEKERHHLARQLHDEIGQVLSTIVVNLQAAK